MADLLNIVNNVNKFTPSFRPADISPRFGPQQNELTQADMAIMPHIQQAKGEFEKKRGVKGFLKKLFEVLQTGNYITANVADSLYDSYKQQKPVGEAIGDMLREAWKGLSHQEKTTFSDVIKQNAEEYGEFLGLTGEEWAKPIGLFGIKEDPETKFGQIVKAIQEQITLQGTVGLAGDIILDPLTYVNPLSWVKPLKGASQAALKAGGKYADDAVKLAILNKNLDELVGIAGSKAAAKQVKTIAGQAGDILPKIEDIASSNVDFSRYIKNLMKKAKKEGTLRPAAELGEEMTENLGRTTERMLDSELGRMAKSGAPYEDAMRAIDDPASINKTLGDVTESINKGYSGAGERARRGAFWGERNIHEGQANAVARTFDYFGEMIKSKIGETKVGQTLSDAVWSVFNNPKSPIANIKQGLGIRNPYQKILHQRLLDTQTYGHYVTSELIPKFQAARNVMGDDSQLISKAMDVRILAESAEFAARKGDAVANTAQFMEQMDAAVLARIGIDEDEFRKIKEFWQKTDDIIQEMHEKELAEVANGIIPDHGTVVNYLPKHAQDLKVKGRSGKLMGTQRPGFTEKTAYTAEESIDQMVQQYKVFFGDMFGAVAKEEGLPVDDLIRRYVLENNITFVDLNLDDMFNRRIVAHGRTMQRARMVEEFREFGVRMEDLGIEGDVFRQGVTRPGGGLPPVGLQNVQDTAYKGYLFDSEVAEIINRTYDAASTDQAIVATKGLFGKATALWKGWATATSGFHMRNHISNDFTGFMRHGLDWYNPQKYAEASILAHYALHPEKYMDEIGKNLDVSKPFVVKTLNRKVNGIAQKDLVDYAREKGLVGWGTFFSDVEKKVVSPQGKKWQKAIYPLSQENLVFKGSRYVGDLFETKAKLQSFLMTFEQLGRGELDEGVAKISDQILRSASELDWAKLDTQKWFINYNDLTEFERKVLKPVMPFYTWLRKNMANQLNAITMYPGVYALAADVTEEFTLEGFPFVLQPDWQKELGYIPVAQDQEGNYMMFFPNLPYQDLNKIPLEWEEGRSFPSMKGENAWEELASNAHPLMKWVVEMITKMNTFKKREMLEYVKAPGLMQFFAKSPKLIEWLDGFMSFLGNDNGLRINVRNGRVEIDEMMERTLTTFLPVLRSLEKMVDAGMDLADWVNPAFEAMVEEKTGRKDDYEELEDLLQHLSFFGGLKGKMFQEEYETERANEEIEERAQQLQRQERQRLPGYERRVQDFLESQTERRQRRGLY